MAEPDQAPGDSSLVISAEAAKAVNQEMIQRLTAGLLDNSEVDLMSLIPPTYEAQLRDRPQFSY
jgi:hypothetical protein